MMIPYLITHVVTVGLEIRLVRYTQGEVYVLGSLEQNEKCITIKMQI